MKKLLSLPPNLVGTFHDITALPSDEYFCTCDPIGHRLGSGGGTAWLLQEACRHEQAATGAASDSASFSAWLKQEKRILLHAGGQSRRLPSYAPSGKILTPIPVFRWECGQRLGQDLLSLQLPLYERIMAQAPDSIHTMVVSGDVLIRATERLQPIPEADVVCYGLWLDATVAKNHGVFVSDRRTPMVLKQMLQKPSVETLGQLLQQHFYLTDIGIWLLSDRAVELLIKRSTALSPLPNPETPTLPHSCTPALPLKEYDLYSEFGCALGTDPTIDDEELRSLSVAVVPLQGGEFYHFGTSREMISSTLAIQNLVNDQREIMHRDSKPHPSIFTQNALTRCTFTPQNSNIWVENSCVGAHWRLTSDHIITGVPENDWAVSLQPGQCVDVVPIGATHYAVRCYHIDDRFAGDEQQRKQFPVVERVEEIGRVVSDFAAGRASSAPSAASRPLLSAEEISNEANLQRLFDQRQAFRNRNWSALAANWEHSVFFQLDLDDAAQQFEKAGLPLPEPLPETAPLMTRIHDAMFRGDSDRAFGLLREGIISTMHLGGLHPRKSVYQDQIVWGRSPVRIDIAGGWTDTPPYCLMEGGSVVNMAIELNGQQPIQTYVKPCAQPHIILRSIDLGAMEVVESYDDLAEFHHVGSPFSIPKAALVLAGFHPDFSAERYPSLRAQLEDFGCGIELTLLSAIPAGSGLGTSSILAATVLGAVSDFCSLAWDKNEIGRRTLVLEQLLTTGGGWQDQFGGVLGGVKLLQTERGFSQSPQVRWLPDALYTAPEYAPCHLLYYTGITRTAKTILAEIVRRMFLNHNGQLAMLRDMKAHAMDTYEAIQRQDFGTMGALIRRTWEQKQALDSGTNPAAIRAITDVVDDLCLGYKLPGAGGGGFLYMVAKDPEAAARIKQLLNQYGRNGNARFVEMQLSRSGLQVSRS
ncbi:MAG: bifunctional fucokinase/L-fucose-1-P-guanylyltransferase [Prevotella sp.]|nr:bifunctional fucokinase/L-fucose-1-P-guanylyltransferase [Prevotella sp.]